MWDRRNLNVLARHRMTMSQRNDVMWLRKHRGSCRTCQPRHRERLIAAPTWVPISKTSSTIWGIILPSLLDTQSEEAVALQEPRTWVMTSISLGLLLWQVRVLETFRFFVPKIHYEVSGDALQLWHVRGVRTGILVNTFTFNMYYMIASDCRALMLMPCVLSANPMPLKPP